MGQDSRRDEPQVEGDVLTGDWSNKGQDSNKHIHRIGGQPRMVEAVTSPVNLGWFEP